MRGAPHLHQRRSQVWREPGVTCPAKRAGGAAMFSQGLSKRAGFSRPLCEALLCTQAACPPPHLLLSDQTQATFQDRQGAPPTVNQGSRSGSASPASPTPASATRTSFRHLCPRKTSLHLLLLCLAPHSPEQLAWGPHTCTQSTPEPQIQVSGAHVPQP